MSKSNVQTVAPNAPKAKKTMSRTTPEMVPIRMQLLCPNTPKKPKREIHCSDGVEPIRFSLDDVYQD